MNCTLLHGKPIQSNAISPHFPPNKKRRQGHISIVRTLCLLVGLFFGMTSVWGQVQNVTRSTSFSTIQAAINDAATVNGDVIEVDPGTYTENIVVNKDVTINGSGPSTIISPATGCTGNGITISASGATIHNLKVTNFNYGIVVSTTNVTIDQVESVANCNAGLELQTGTTNLTITNSKLNNNTSIGFRKGTAAIVNGFTMSDCEVTGNNQGCFIAKNNGAGGTFDNISISNSDFSNNTQKGMYFEALSNAVLDGITMDNSGTDAGYANNNGIDINLKYGSYSNITIINSNITNCGANGTASNPEASTAVTIKARNDGSYASNPATLSNVTLENNLITGPQNGIRIGEYGAINAGPTNVLIKENNLAGPFAHKTVISRTNANINLDCNWHGTTDPVAIASTFVEAGSGDLVLSKIKDAINGNCVCPGGTVTNINTSQTYCSIQAAVNAANPNDVIVVDAGTYSESVLVNKSVEIRGAQYGNSVIGRTSGDASESTVNAPAGQNCFTIVSPGVIIQGFTLNGSGGISRGVYENTPVVGTTVKENFISGFTGSLGVSMAAGSTGFVVDGNDIRNNYVGVYLSNTANSGSITNNVITAHVDGALDQGSAIAFEGGQNNVTVTNNNLSGNGNALFAWNYSAFGTNTIEGNNMSNNTDFAVQNSSTNSLAIGCNWFGSANRILINAELSGPVTYTTFLHSGTDTDAAVGHQPTNTCSANGRWYVNDGSNIGSVFTSAGGNNANPGTAASPFRNIQFAINQAVAGDTIYVDAGNYNENVTMNKALQLYGSNYQIPPSGARNVEAAFFPAVSDPDPGTGSPILYLTGTTSGSTVAGFTFDGDNPYEGSGLEINGVDIDATIAIAMYGSASSLTIENNIIKNLSYAGIELASYPLSLPASVNNSITNNLIDNVEGLPVGVGILTHYNAYAVIEDNVITNVRGGFQTGNFTKANTGTPATFSNNQVTSSRRGIFHNVIYNGSSPHTIANNTLTAKAGSTNSWGISFGHISPNSSATIQNNTISGHQVGIDFWDCRATNAITVVGGTLANNRVGVRASNFDGYNANVSGNVSVKISGVTIHGSDTSVWVKDNPLNTNGAKITLTIDDDCDIYNSGQTKSGILVSGPDATAIVTGNDASIHGFAIGIDVDGGSATIDNNHIYDNGIGVRVTNSGTATIHTNNFEGAADPDNGTDVALTTTAGIVTASPDNSFAGTTAGVDNQSAAVVNATNNYWAHASGPSGEGFGTGVAVSENVDFCPWLGDEPIAFGGTGVAGTFRVTNTNTLETFCTIQAAIDDADTQNGHTISAVAGTYVENILVNKELEIVGAGIGQTIILPALSGATPPSCPGSDCAGASNVIKLAANNIHLHGFTIDGDNPAITSGVVVGGADIEARNGIIGDGITNRSNIEINNIEVKNIYLRGIYPQYTTNMNVHHNTVTNVQGATGSIAIFSWVSSGVVDNNTVSFANDGIAANHSNGITFSNNTVSNSGSGIHTDNNGSGGPAAADVITNNTVSDGTGLTSYGIWAFVPYLDVVISNNTVNNVHVGLLTTSSLFTSPTVTVTGNTVDGMGLAGSYGSYFTTTTFGYGDGNNTTIFTNNIIQNTDQVMLLEANAGFTVDLTANDNSFTGNSAGISKTGAGTITEDLSCNWWGGASEAAVVAAVGAGTNYTPWLTNGTDDDVAAGFQPVPGSCLGSPIVISSTVPSPETCGNLGQIEVTWTGGVGPYDIAWTGGGSATGVTSPYAITGLAAGLYDITVTDANNTVANTSATVLDLPVTNTTQNTHYATIQAAINAASTGEVILVCDGTYAENVQVNKAIHLSSVNGAGVTIIEPTSGYPVSITAHVGGPFNGVTIDGFTLNSHGTIALISLSGTNDGYNVDGLTLQNLIVDANGQFGLALFDVNNTLIDNVNISNANTGMEMIGMANLSINNSSITGSTGKAINLWKTSGYENNTNISITNSSITGGTTNVIAIDMKSVTGTLTLDENDISNNVGFGFRIDNTPGDNALALNITNNEFIDNGGVAVYIEDDNILDQITAIINNNIFDGNRKAIGAEAILSLTIMENIFHNSTQNAVEIFTTNVLIEHNSFVGNAALSLTSSQPISADCNWWGSAASGDIALVVGAGIDYTPWITNGTDNDGVAPGFQPVPGTCLGSPIVISSTIASPETCGVPGQIEVTWTGGIAPYDIAWTGGSATGVASPYTITGLAAGAYTITLTDAVASSAMSNANVDLYPVTNTTQSLFYATIQAAINAAASGDVLTVCAGTYTENITINKPLTINGPNVGVAGTDSRGPEAILSDCNIDITAAGSVVFDGFKIYQTNNNADVVLISGGTAATIQNNIFERFGAVAGQSVRAITTSAGSGVKNIQNNLFTGDPSGGLFGGHKTWQSGIYVNGAASSVNLLNNTFDITRSALNLDDFQAGIVLQGNTFKNNGTHISFGGVAPTTGQYVLGANEFNVTTFTTLMNLSNVATAFRLDVTSSTFNGSLASALPFADLFAIESFMYHRGRSGRNGLVVYHVNNEYVTSTALTTIQSAVDYADPGFVINLQAGNYNESVIVTKSLTIDGETSLCSDVVINGGGVRAYGVQINANITNVVLNDFKILNTVGTGGGINAFSGNNGLNIDNICLENTAGLGAIKLQGPVDGVTINNCEIWGPGVNGRGIVIWVGFKENITITNNNVHDISGCCGIELQDGNASGVTMTGNTVTKTSDSGMSAVGLNGTTGPNVISGNTITDCGRFGLEIKNPNGATTVDGNTISITTAFSTLKPSEVRDIAGIAVIRRAVGPGNPDYPSGVTVTNNIVTGYIQDNGASQSEGFGIVIEGLYNTVSGNTINSSDVGVQFQAKHQPYPGDGDQSDLADQYFGRGNAQETCSNTLGSNTFNMVGTDTRSIGSGDGLVTNITTGELFCSIQSAIDDADTQNGDVIQVAAGTYAEDVVVNKSVSILGPNAANPACDGPRDPEAIIVPATNNISGGVMFSVEASDVTISGLTIDGDNTNLTSGFLGTNGADINSAAGVVIYVNNINNLTVTNNKFSNLSYFGVELFGFSFSAPATSGHNISGNSFKDMGTYDAGSGISFWGGGVLLYNNQYAAVEDNCMTNVRIGVQTGNFSRANPGTAASQVISNNIIEARRLGIFHNLFYGPASAYTVSANTITGLAHASESIYWNGLLVTSLSGAQHVIQGNDVDGSGISSLTTTGINIWNDQLAPLVDGNTITGVEIGINVNNFEGYPATGSNANNTSAIITGSTITGATVAGIKIHDNPSNTNGATVTATIGSDNTITGSPVGILVLGSDATATITENDLVDNVIGVQVTEAAQADINTNDFTGTLNQSDIQATATAGAVVASPNNNLSGSAYGIENLSATTIDGTLNYWNDTDDSGPGAVGTGTGVPVTTNVDYCPWLDDAAPVGVPVNAAGGTIEVTENGGPTPDDGSVCSGEAVTLAVTGAQAGSTYLWSTSETTASINVNPTVTTNYTVSVTYGGCESVLTYEIIVYPVPTIDLVSLQNVLCNGGNTGSIEVAGATGPAPYTYLWSNGPTTALNANLVAGNYTVTMTDANLCTVESITYTVTEPPVLSVVNFAISNESCVGCANGSITVNATGGTSPYQYSNDGGATWQSSNFFGGLSFGTYSIVVKDANGCETVPQNVSITVNGAFADLTATRFISSTNYYLGDVSNEVVRIRNKGAGPTYAAIEFTISLPSAASGMVVSDNNAPTVTILGTTYTLDNSDFTYTDLGSLRTYTTNVTLLPNEFIDIGIIHTRAGGSDGDYNSTVNIINGTGGGETNSQNNIAVFKMIKL